MNKHLFYTLVWLAMACPAVAQQLPLLSQLQESVGVLNPAALSSSYLYFGNDFRIGATYHGQWTQIEGGPRTSQLVVETVFEDYSPITPLAGAYLITDQTGPTGFSGLYAKVGGILSDDPATRGVSIALQAGVNQYRLRFDELQLRDPEAVLASGDDGRIFPDVGLGIFAYETVGDNVFYAGLSAPQVLGLNFSFRGADGRVETQRYAHYYAQAGAILRLRDEAFLEPTAWVKHVPNLPTNITASLRYQSSTALYVGLGGSSSRTIHAEGGVVLGDRSYGGRYFRIGYGFDYAFRRYGPYAGGTHEINLTYAFDR